MVKIKSTHLMVIVIAGIIAAPTLWTLGQYVNLQLFPPEPGVVPGTVAVNRVIDFGVVDKYAGNGTATAVIAIYEGSTLLESITTASDGTQTTTFTYPSDKELNVKVTKTNSKCWYKVTVPRMSKEDAQGTSANSISLQFFSVATITDAIRDGAGNSIGDGAAYNASAVSTVTTFTYSMFVGTDNTGFMASEDPVQNMRWDAVIYTKLSGTAYSDITVTGHQVYYEKGTNYYGATTLAATEITKYKVGNTYVHDGSTSTSWTLDLSGYTNSSGNYATMQVYLKIYSDPSYHQAKGSFGPDVVELAETTVLLYSG